LARLRRSSTEVPEIPEEDVRLLDRFVAKVRDLPGLQAVVLFGSFARRDIDRRSDIDVLLVFDSGDPGSLRSRVAAIVGELRPHRDINPVLTNLRDLDASFLRNVFREGVVLHGKLLLGPDHLALQSRVLIAYDLAGMAPSDKVQISRLVHGFRSRKTVGGRRRVYEYPGLKGRPGAVPVSRSVLMLRPEDAAGFERELERRRIRYARWDVCV
jgi:predicted nucleotidyltransferase